MGARGRGGNFRGRGSRGRGRGGPGKSFRRFGPSRRFDSGRLQDEDEESDPSSGKEDADELDIDSEIDEEDDDDDATTKRPYMSLLQSLSANQPNSKRRKLNRDPRSPSSDAGDTADDDTDAGGKELDLVEEGDDGEDEQVEDDAEDDSEDEEPTDPFDVHFAHPDELTSASAVGQAKKGNWSTKRMLMNTLRATTQSPGTDTVFNVPATISGVDDLKLKKKLLEGVGSKLSTLHAPQKAFASLLFDYKDILFSERTPSNAQEHRQLICLHVLNHVFKTRDRVIKNNHKLAKDGGDSELELRDQGFTRPKVLFLLPTRNSCAKMIATIRELCKPDQEENRKRFDESYITKDASFGGDRPEDFRDLFEGNDDDMFRVGVKFTRKTIKYFAQFYNSDILFASPLGLRMAIGSEEDKKKPDYDFLSSIEMVVVDQADALLMQNWEHVEYIFEHLNLQPKDAHGCDFSRVRNWYLEDWAKYFRQTIITSAFNTPELAELQRLYCQNWAGKVRLQSEYSGHLQQLGVKSKQTFSRFQASSVEKEPDARFEYFVSAIVPSLVKRSKDVNGTLLFIPSYLDFVRVRNYFATALEVSSVPFGAISEYTDVPEASRARSHFLNGRHKVLLYSERAHHFRRYQFKGVQRVIFYGLPDNPIFYKEIAGDSLAKSEQDMTIEPGRGTVRAIFSKYDAMKLERIAGSKRVGKMIQDRGDTFDFV